MGEYIDNSTTKILLHVKCCTLIKINQYISCSQLQFQETRDPDMLDSFHHTVQIFQVQSSNVCFKWVNYILLNSKTHYSIIKLQYSTYTAPSLEKSICTTVHQYLWLDAQRKGINDSQFILPKWRHNHKFAFRKIVGIFLDERKFPRVKNFKRGDFAPFKKKRPFFATCYLPCTAQCS